MLLDEIQSCGNNDFDFTYAEWKLIFTNGRYSGSMRADVKEYFDECTTNDTQDSVNPASGVASSEECSCLKVRREVHGGNVSLTRSSSPGAFNVHRAKFKRVFSLVRQRRETLNQSSRVDLQGDRLFCLLGNTARNGQGNKQNGVFDPVRWKNSVSVRNPRFCLLFCINFRVHRLVSTAFAMKFTSNSRVYFQKTLQIVSILRIQNFYPHFPERPTRHILI